MYSVNCNLHLWTLYFLAINFDTVLNCIILCKGA